jgi:hypothetical protein
MKNALVSLAVAMSAAGVVHAQQLKPVWEYLVNKPGSPIPVLTNALNGWTTDSETGDGTSVLDSLGALQRYDANRLLLGIRENGINESSASDAQKALAAQYPDRSLIWINPTNGSPLGIALNIGLTPVPLDADFIAAGGSPVQYWWTYAVASDGSIYTGYKNKILRYNPDGKGGIDSTPHVVFTLTQDAFSNYSGVDPTLWSGWRWKSIRVIGTGTNTKLLAGTSSSARGTFLLTTTDGNTFSAGSRLTAAGGISTPVPSGDAAAPDDLWVYAGIYPGNSNGTDSSYSRYIVSPPFTDNFSADASFTAPLDAASTNDVHYRADFIGDVDANAAVPYLVSYSTPSWNSRAVGIPDPRPGWLALSTPDGTFVSSHELNVTEDTELLPTDQASDFQGTIGFLSLNKLTDGTVEVLWSGTIYGYGRYLVQTGQTTGPSLSISLSNSVATISWGTDANGFTLQTATSLSGTPTWSSVGVVGQGTLTSGYTVPGTPAVQFYRLKK